MWRWQKKGMESNLVWGDQVVKDELYLNVQKNERTNVNKEDKEECTESECVCMCVCVW